MKKYVSCLVLAIFISALTLSACGKQKKQIQLPPPQVVVADVIQKDVPIYSEWVASLDGYVNAQIRAQVQGYLIKQNYGEGLFVNKGDLLFELDDRPFVAALEKAKGDLAQAEAVYGKTQMDVARYTPLAKEAAISQQELDNAIQQNLGAKAQVEAAQAAVSQAQVNLDFTKITSPIDGIAGIAQAQIGDLVGPAQNSVLTTVSTLDPIKVFFPVSEQEYMRAAQRINEAETDNDPKTRGGLDLILADGNIYPEKGKFIIADRQIDPQTGTMKIAAAFPNPKNILRPGQYARVRAVTSQKKNALLVPQRAVNELQGSYQIAVVDAKNIVDIRTVKPTDRVDTLWVIDEGLEAGERVVVEGIQKVKDGMTVAPVPAPQEQSA